MNASKKIGLVLSIREKASRLPGKVLKEINGLSTTEHLLTRMKLTNNFDEIIIGTSDDPRDKVFKEIAELCDVKYFFGDQEDKLLRYYQICNAFDLDGVVIVDGDDILCFPEVMDVNAKFLKETDFDVVFWKNLPLGAASSALTKSALWKVLNIKNENDTEVWGGYFINSGKFNIHFATSSNELWNKPTIRMTMDYEEDFIFLCNIFEELKDSGNKFSTDKLMNLLVNVKPEINEITIEAQRKYLEHIAKAAPVKFKKED